MDASPLSKLRSLHRDRAQVKRQLRWLGRKTRPYLGRLGGLMALDGTVTVMSIGCTLINKQLIDRAAASGFEGRYFTLLAILTLMSVGVGALSGALGQWLHQRYAFGVRAGVYGRVMGGLWEAVGGYHSGDVMTRLTSDVDQAANGIATLIPDLMYLVLRLTLSFLVLYQFDKYLALFALALGPVGVLATLMLSGPVRRIHLALKENESAYRSFMQDSLQNLAVVKAFEAGGHFEDRLAGLGKARMAIVKKKGALSAAMRLAMGATFSLGYLAAFLWGIALLSRGQIGYGTMSVFLSLVGQVQGPIVSLANMAPQWINVLAAAGRVMDMDQLAQEPPGQAPALAGPIGIALEGVSFRYKRQQVLKNVNLVVPPGATVGLMGQSGAGKTTIARLLLALLSPQRGQVLFFDAQGRRAPASAATRRLIAYVPQGNTLFSGTIRENLQLGDPAASDQAMWEALSRAQAHQFVEKLPGGLDYALPERGAALSEGQAQRIAIARALIKGAPILILDEATSALDGNTQAAIAQQLSHRLPGITCLIITHRKALAALTQDVYQVLADGRVVGGRVTNKIAEGV